MKKNIIFEEGKQAFVEGKLVSDNPYKGQKQKELFWGLGWNFSRKNKGAVCGR